MEKTKLSEALVNEIYSICRDYVYTMNHNEFRRRRTEICIKICKEIYNIEDPSLSNICILGLKIFREYDYDFIIEFLAEKYRRDVKYEFSTESETTGYSDQSS